MIRMLNRLLDRKLATTLKKLELPTTPEVMTYARASFWRGLSFGAYKPDLHEMREAALVSVSKHYEDAAWCSYADFLRDMI